MARLAIEIKDKIIALRKEGYTYTAIQSNLGISVPKSTLSYICNGIQLTPEQSENINQIMLKKIEINRQKALVANRSLFEAKLNHYRTSNLPLAKFMQDKRAQKIALAILYLGEGSKWKSHRGLQLGSSDPNIIRLYISLLESCYGITRRDLKCRVQHRADQISSELVTYWTSVTNIGERNFYSCYIDKRTIGHKTHKEGYRGVCVISCAGTHIQLELQEITGIIFGATWGYSSVD